MAADKILRSGPDSDLQRFGKRIITNGAKFEDQQIKEKRAKTAMARKLAKIMPGVLTQSPYEFDSECEQHKPHENHIKFVVTCENPPVLLDSTEQSLHLVAPLVGALVVILFRNGQAKMKVLHYIIVKSLNYVYQFYDSGESSRNVRFVAGLCDEPNVEVFP